jgi:hypothetical protein
MALLKYSRWPRTDLDDRGLHFDLGEMIQAEAVVGSPTSMPESTAIARGSRVHCCRARRAATLKAA